MRKTILMLVLMVCSAAWGSLASPYITAAGVAPNAGYVPVNIDHSDRDTTLTTQGKGVPATSDPWPISTKTYINDGHAARLMVSGTIAQVKYTMHEKHDNPLLKFVVYRWDAADSNYKKIGISEGIVPTLADGVEETATLSSPIAALRGDYLAVELSGVSKGYVGERTAIMTYSALLHAEEHTLATSDFCVHSFDGNAPDSNAFSAADGWGYNIKMTALMTPPIWVSMGDSFAAGSAYSTSFLSPIYGSGLSNPIQTTEQNLLGYCEDINAAFFRYANCGNGGSDTNNWMVDGNNWITTRVLPLKPRFALVSLGTNDKLVRLLTYDQFIVNFASIITTLKANDITPVVMLPPHVVSDAWAASLKLWCKTNNIVWFDFHLIIDATQTDSGPFEENTGHPLPIGYSNLAAALYGQLTVPRDLPDVNNVRSGTTYDMSDFTGTLAVPAAGNVKRGITYDSNGMTGTLDITDLRGRYAN